MTVILRVPWSEKIEIFIFITRLWSMFGQDLRRLFPTLRELLCHLGSPSLLFFCNCIISIFFSSH